MGGGGGCFSTGGGRRHDPQQDWGIWCDVLCRKWTTMHLADRSGMLAAALHEEHGDITPHEGAHRGDGYSWAVVA